MLKWKSYNSSMRVRYEVLTVEFNSLRPRQNGRHFAGNIFKCIFLNENVWIPIKISLKFVPQGPINNIPELVQIMAWRWPGDKPLSGPMMVRLSTHICVIRPQWVKVWHNMLPLFLLLNPIHSKWFFDIKTARVIKIYSQKSREPT